MKEELEKKRRALRKRPTSISEASGNAVEKGDCDSTGLTEEFLKVWYNQDCWVTCTFLHSIG